MLMPRLMTEHPLHGAADEGADVVVPCWPQGLILTQKGRWITLLHVAAQ